MPSEIATPSETSKPSPTSRETLASLETLLPTSPSPMSPLRGGLAALADSLSTDAIVESLLADTRSDATRLAYQSDLRQFAAWAGVEYPSGLEAITHISETGRMAQLLTAFKISMLDAKLSEATVNRRLSAVRALLTLARKLGAPCPDVRGLVSSEKSAAYRDTRGPGLEGLRAVLHGAVSLRDRALLQLLAENGLRRAEVTRLDVSDVDLAGKRVMLLGKGRGSQKEPITISAVTVAAIQEYLAERGDPEPGDPLFVSEAHNGTRGHRLTGEAVRLIVEGIGKRAGIGGLAPHKLRHAAITAVLDATKGDVRTAQRFSRHRDIRTLQQYDDNREDLQGVATELLSNLLT